MKSLEKKIKEIDNSFDSFFNENNNDFELDAKLLASKFLSEVKDISEAKKINRKELAKLIGTSPSYLTQLYRGTKIMNLITLCKIKKVLDLDVEIKIKNNFYNCEVDDSNYFYVNHTNQQPLIKWTILKNIKQSDNLDNDLYTIQSYNKSTNCKIIAQ